MRESRVGRYGIVWMGRRSQTAAEALTGLVPGARVVLHPPVSVADGVRVVERG